MTTFLITPEAHKAYAAWAEPQIKAARERDEARKARPLQQRAAKQGDIDAELTELYQHGYIKPIKRYCPPKSQKHSGVLGARRAKERGRRQHNARMQKRGGR